MRAIVFSLKYLLSCQMPKEDIESVFRQYQRNYNLSGPNYSLCFMGLSTFIMIPDIPLYDVLFLNILRHQSDLFGFLALRSEIVRGVWVTPNSNSCSSTPLHGHLLLLRLCIIFNPSNPNLASLPCTWVIGALHFFNLTASWISEFKGLGLLRPFTFPGRMS